MYLSTEKLPWYADPYISYLNNYPDTNVWSGWLLRITVINENYPDAYPHITYD